MKGKIENFKSVKSNFTKKSRLFKKKIKETENLLIKLY